MAKISNWAMSPRGLNPCDLADDMYSRGSNAVLVFSARDDKRLEVHLTVEECTRVIASLQRHVAREAAIES